MDRNEELWSQAQKHARRFLGRFDDAFTRSEQEDLVQDSTLAAWQWAASIREPDRLAAVVRTIARRKRCRALREHYRRRERERQADSRHQLPAGLGVSGLGASGFAVLGRSVPHEWLIPRLLRALERLRSIDHRILMALLEGFCCAEIADRYQLSRENVKVRLHRARHRVRREIEDAVRTAEQFEES